MYFKIRVTPEAKSNSLKSSGLGRFDISVREKASNNFANRRALQLLADHLKVPSRSIRIMNGHTSPNKVVYIRPSI